MSITSAQGYEMRIARQGDRIADPPQPYWQTVERLLADRGSIMSPAFWLTRYVIWTTRQAKRELCYNERHHWSPPQDSPLHDQAERLRHGVIDLPVNHRL
jgi:hypothetical protein